MRSIMHLHTCNTIVEKENADQKAILHARKHQLSGKRQVIDGKHLMMGAELIEVWEAEEAIKQRKKALMKGTQKWKGKPKAKESSDESESSSYITDDEEVEILDCIVVET